MDRIIEAQPKEENIKELSADDANALYSLTDKAYYVDEIHYKFKDNICISVVD
jgi:hypothetical protein